MGHRWERGYRCCSTQRSPRLFAQALAHPHPRREYPACITPWTTAQSVLECPQTDRRRVARIDRRHSRKASMHPPSYPSPDPLHVSAARCALPSRVLPPPIVTSPGRAPLQSLPRRVNKFPRRGGRSHHHRRARHSTSITPYPLVAHDTSLCLRLPTFRLNTYAPPTRTVLRVR